MSETRADTWLDRYRFQEDFHVPYSLAVVKNWLHFWLRGGETGFPVVKLKTACCGANAEGCSLYVQVGDTFERATVYGTTTIVANVHLTGDGALHRSCVLKPRRNRQHVSPEERFTNICYGDALCFHLAAICENLTEINAILRAPVALPLYVRVLTSLEIRGAQRLQPEEVLQDTLAATGWGQDPNNSKGQPKHTPYASTGMPKVKVGRPRSAIDDEAWERVKAGEKKSTVLLWWKEAVMRENPERLEGIDSTPEEIFKGVLKRRRAQDRHNSPVQKD